MLSFKKCTQITATITSTILADTKTPFEESFYMHHGQASGVVIALHHSL
jgi:hypothetical protein